MNYHFSEARKEHVIETELSYGDEFVIALSSVMAFWSAFSYVRFRSVFCFIAAIIVWLICYFGFSYKKENCINWIRELVEGQIVL